MKQTKIYKLASLSEDELTGIAQHLTQGALAVLATDTVYGLGTGAFCEETIAQICALKNRPLSQPMQLLVSSVEEAEKLAVLNPPAQQLARAYWPGALTLILPPTEQGKKLLRGAQGLGLRVPDFDPLNRLLARMPVPLACTSANLHGQPVITDETCLENQFGGQVDYILTAGTLSPVASSVVNFICHPPRLLRAGKISKIELSRTSGVLFQE